MHKFHFLSNLTKVWLTAFLVLAILGILNSMSLGFDFWFPGS